MTISYYSFHIRLKTSKEIEKKNDYIVFNLFYVLFSFVFFVVMIFLYNIFFYNILCINHSTLLYLPSQISFKLKTEMTKHLQAINVNMSMSVMTWNWWVLIMHGYLFRFHTANFKHVCRLPLHQFAQSSAFLNFFSESIKCLQRP